MLLPDTPSGFGRLRFSTISAWDKSVDVDSLIVERFQSVSLAWSVTDEFGNFHYTHNPDGLTDLPAFALNGLLYSEDDLDELAGDLRAFIDIPDGGSRQSDECLDWCLFTDDYGCGRKGCL